MDLFKVVEPLRHDGEDYAPGSEVQLEPRHSDPLLAFGVIEHLAHKANQVPTLGDMTKAQLVAYAKNSYDVDLDPER